MKAYSLDDITWVSIETTNVCNMTCDYCPKSLDELNHRKIGVDILAHNAYLNIVDFLPRLKNLKYVTLTAFNEFFQTPELTSFYLPELQKRMIPYSIMSNGSVKPKNIDYYIGHNPKYLVLGVQTITEDQFYDNNRLEKVSWERYLDLVADNIRFFYDKCPETLISIEVAVNPHNTWWQKATGAVTNQAIPSKNEQLKKLPEFVETLSKMTGIEFIKNTEQMGRYSGQKIIFGSKDARIGFGLKDFHDISEFYNNIPLSQAPICYADSLTFNVNGTARMCCIDFRNSTKFGDASSEEVETIFEKYLVLVDEMRQKGSPFSDCRNCMGYKSRAEKYLNPVKPIKEYVKRYSSAVRVYKNLTR